MIVKWTEQRLLVIPIFANDKDAKDLQTTTVPQVVLFPGWNDIADPQWQDARIRIPERIQAGTVIELADVRKGAEGKADKVVQKTLADLDPKRAIQIVTETVNPFTLKKWDSEEVRDGVLKSIRDRITEIETKAPNSNEAMKKEYKVK